MKIAVLYNRDIYALNALNRLLPALSRHSVALFHSSHVGRSGGAAALALQDLQQFEAGLLAAVDARAGAGHDSLLGFKALGNRYQISDSPLNHVNTPEGRTLLHEGDFDLALSIRFGKILKQPAIDLFPLGVMNLHSGLLPAYRGVMPTFWAMLAEEESIGSTLHWITDATIDTGEQIHRSTQLVKPGLSYVSQVWSLYAPGIRGMVDAVHRIAEGQLKRPQGHCAADLGNHLQAGSYFTFPSDGHLTQFSDQGLVLFDDQDLLTVY